jgi:hypothetical protein
MLFKSLVTTKKEYKIFVKKKAYLITYMQYKILKKSNIKKRITYKATIKFIKEWWWVM